LQPFAHNAQPALLLGRGYTGHEHLPEFGLINMNARLYDPVLGRFLNADPYVQAPDNTQNFNRYSYAFNNPLIYTDPDGELAFLVPALIVIGKAALTGAAIHAGMYTLSVAMSPGGFNNWNWGQFGYAALNGAINGAISGAMGHFGMPSWNLGGGFSIGIQPNLMVSSNGMGFGATVGLDYGITKWMSAGVDIGFNHYFMTTGTEKQNQQLFTFGYGLEFGNKKNNVSLYSTHYAASDGSSQRVGGLGVNIGKFNMRYENDGAPPFWGILGSNKDQYRTAAAQIGWGDWNLRLNMMTGPGSRNADIDEYGSSKYPYGYYKGGGVDNVRLGALSLGYKNYRIGANSEAIRHTFQNQIIHNAIGQAGFKQLDNYWHPYYHWGTTNRYSLW
jgi:RHS repeat-associated protein